MNDEGSSAEFRKNWTSREEVAYSHFTRGEPKNQIQLAFRNHWKTWSSIFPELAKTGSALEVGSGRGTMSMYFSQHGWETTILDIIPEVLDQAKRQFSLHSLCVTPVVGDCLEMPLADNSFDVVFSVGLLEHFSDPRQALREQLRVLAPGGLLIGYVVPEPSAECIQHSYEWVNDLLRGLTNDSPISTVQAPKSVVYRSEFRSEHYSLLLSNLGCEDIGSSGTYPLPMISRSAAFPFSLLPAPAESSLTYHFQQMLAARQMDGWRDSWLCDEEYGQAFLVWGKKAHS